MMIVYHDDFYQNHSLKKLTLNNLGMNYSIFCLDLPRQLDCSDRHFRLTPLECPCPHPHLTVWDYYHFLIFQNLFGMLLFLNIALLKMIFNL
jgi:hypothetical protein